MTITLTAEIEGLVNEQVKSGAFHSAEEVLLEGLRLLKARQEKLAELRREIQIGVEAIQQGRYTVCTTDEDFDNLAATIVGRAQRKKDQAGAA